MGSLPVKPRAPLPSPTQHPYPVRPIETRVQYRPTEATARPDRSPFAAPTIGCAGGAAHGTATWTVGPCFPELAGGAGTRSATIDTSGVAGWKPHTAGRARCFRHHKHFYSSLSAAVRTPLWRYGWARWPPARSNGAADGRERRASRWLRRMMSCVDVCDERLASRARAALD